MNIISDIDQSAIEINVVDTDRQCIHYVQPQCIFGRARRVQFDRRNIAKLAAAAIVTRLAKGHYHAAYFLFRKWPSANTAIVDT